MPEISEETKEVLRKMWKEVNHPDYESPAELLDYEDSIAYDGMKELGASEDILHLARMAMRWAYYKGRDEERITV